VRVRDKIEVKEIGGKAGNIPTPKKQTRARTTTSGREWEWERKRERDTGSQVKKKLSVPSPYVEATFLQLCTGIIEEALDRGSVE